MGEVEYNQNNQGEVMGAKQNVTRAGTGAEPQDSGFSRRSWGEVKLWLPYRQCPWIGESLPSLREVLHVTGSIYPRWDLAGAPCWQDEAPLDEKENATWQSQHVTINTLGSLFDTKITIWYTIASSWQRACAAHSAHWWNSIEIHAVYSPLQDWLRLKPRIRSQRV